MKYEPLIWKAGPRDSGVGSLGDAMHGVDSADSGHGGHLTTGLTLSDRAPGFSGRVEGHLRR